VCSAAILGDAATVSQENSLRRNCSEIQSLPQRAGRFFRVEKVCRSVRDVFSEWKKSAAACGTFFPSGKSLSQRASVCFNVFFVS
jgi:hypothetical protein